MCTVPVPEESHRLYPQPPQAVAPLTRCSPHNHGARGGEAGPGCPRHQLLAVDCANNTRTAGHMCRAQGSSHGATAMEQVRHDALHVAQCFISEALMVAGRLFTTCTGPAAEVTHLHSCQDHAVVEVPQRSLSGPSERPLADEVADQAKQQPEQGRCQHSQHCSTTVSSHG
jgi:hypothetical protein